MTYYHVDGEVVPAEEARVSVEDRGFRYGDAAFETLRAYGGDLFEWEAHADRLANTCEAIGIDHGLSETDLRSRIEETLEANELEDAYVRLSITRGTQVGTLAPLPDVDPTVVVIVDDLPRGGTDGRSVWDDPAKVEISTVQRIPDRAIPARAKTHNYLGGVLARLDRPDADEALLLDADGYLTEGTVSNLFFVRDGSLHTPSVDGPVLPGITRSVVLGLAYERGMPVETGRYALGDLLTADEAFLTNTTWEIRPIASVDGEALGDEALTPARIERSSNDESVTAQLIRDFDRLIEREFYEKH